MISNHQCHPAQRKILISPCTNGLKTWTKRKLLLSLVNGCLIFCLLSFQITKGTSWPPEEIPRGMYLLRSLVRVPRTIDLSKLTPVLPPGFPLSNASLRYLVASAGVARFRSVLSHHLTKSFSQQVANQRSTLVVVWSPEHSSRRNPVKD